MKQKKILLFKFLIILIILTVNMNFNALNNFTPDKIIKITAERFKFTPDTITIKKGIKVRLQVQSTDVTHGIAIKGLKINKKLKPGQIVNIDFIADKPGEYTYVCSVPCGKGHKQMRGKLIVE